MGEMGPKVAKLFNLAQIWTCRPLIRPIINQQVMLECPESPKSPHKLVLPENGLSAFYTVILGEMGRNVAKLFNFAQIWTCRPLNKAHNSPTGYIRGPRISQKPQ